MGTAISTNGPKDVRSNVENEHHPVHFTQGRVPQGHPFFVLQLLSYDENVLRRSACSLDFGNLGVRQVAADQNERRRDVIKVEGTQVGYVLAAAEHAESSPEIHLREQNKRNLRRLHTVS